MSNNFVKMSILIGIVFLFFGASVIPTISGNNKTDFRINKENICIKAIDDFILDQKQEAYSSMADMWDWENYRIMYAQSFKPSMTPLTKIEIYLGRSGNPGSPIEVSIRDNLSGEDLSYVSVPEYNIPTSWGFVEFDFPDIEVEPEKTYYIVLRHQYSPLDTHYSLGSCCKSSFDPYSRGCAWESFSSWCHWEKMEDIHPNIGKLCDWCFRTYSYGVAPNIEIVEINGGFRVNAKIINSGELAGSNISWSIDLDGGLILAGGHTEGVIDELAPGVPKTIRQTTLYGIGRTTITVTAGDASRQATAFILGPLVLGVEEIS